MRRSNDLRNPERWYPEARKLRRHVIYNSGPPNSGKTYNALRQFLKARSAVYCCPLRLLAAEVATKSNDAGVPCDMITGEEQQIVDPRGRYASHLATTIQMVDMESKFHVAIIDEIQMLGDPVNGWAFTRALLSLQAPTIYVCGDESAMGLVQHLVESVGDIFSKKPHIRPNYLVFDDPVVDMDLIREGDCVVCFSKKEIRRVARDIDCHGHGAPAVIYGSLPPETKRKQADKFNDPRDPHKILVATDAVGMGMNLKIERIVFYRVQKFMKTLDHQGIQNISVSQTKQIAGRAGRGIRAADGLVTTFKQADMAVLENLHGSNITPIQRAGLRPPPEKIQEFAADMQARRRSLVDLLQTYMDTLQYDEELYFMCSMDDTMYCAELIQDLAIPLADKYNFCIAPVSKRTPLHKTVFYGMVEKYSQQEMINARWLRDKLGWDRFVFDPFTVNDLDAYEEAYDILNLYVWLRNKFKDWFPDLAEVKKLRDELCEKIDSAVNNLSRLIDMDAIDQGGQGRSRGGRGRGGDGRGRGRGRGHYLH